MQVLNPLTVPQGDLRYLLKDNSWRHSVFTATAGQISFTLLEIASDIESYHLSVNGVEYDRLTHYLVSGTTLTWLNLFPLATGDRVVVAYQV